MSDSTVTSLVAITEKKPHKPGSCAGIFFQVFHGNRRFAKNKKMLAQAGAKQASKKFGSDDKLPKFSLIANPNMEVPDSGQKHGMLTPGVVARLMGLDYMPAVQRDKLKKISCSKIESDLVSYDDCLFGKDAGNFGTSSGMHDLRPRKLQKTGSSGRHPVTRFGAEATPFRNVLSRSRKHHQKFASPVKSSTSLSGRHASRLIDAATRIFEPGLKSRNRAQCVLHHNSSPTDGLLEGPYFTNVSRSFNGQSSCRSCNNLPDILDSRQNLVEQPSFSHYVNHSSQGISRSKLRSPMSSLESEKEKLFQKNREKSYAFAAHAMHNAPSQTESILYRMPLQRDARTRWQLTSQQSKSQQDLNYVKSYKQKFRMQDQVSVIRDGMPPKLKLSNLTSSSESGDYYVLNRSFNDQAQSHLPSKLNIREYDTERHTRDMTDYCVPSVRERSLKVIRKSGGSAFVCSRNQIITKSDAMTAKILRGDVQSRVCIKNKFPCKEEGNKATGCLNVHNDVISFIFSSPMKQKFEIHEETNKRRDEVCSCNNIDGHTCSPKTLSLTGDTLGTLLKQKLNELLSQEDDELALGSAPSKRTSSMILQELISALTTARPFHQNDLAFGPYGRNATSSSGHTPNVDARFQSKLKRIGDLQSYSNESNYSLSPVSVIKVPISCEGGLMEMCCIKPQLSEPYFDPAISLSKGRPGLNLVTEILNHTSELLCRVDIVGSRLSGSKLDHAKEVILNAELLLGSSVHNNLDESKGFSISSFLTDELDTLGSVLCTSSSSFATFDNKGSNSLQGFLFDCIIEYMDSRYGKCFKYDNKTPTEHNNASLCINAEILIDEIVKEIVSWRGLASLIPDEQIENEMSCCLGRSFENELFETGAAIDEDIFHFLMDEIVIDLSQIQLDFSH